MKHADAIKKLDAEISRLEREQLESAEAMARRLCERLDAREKRLAAERQKLAAYDEQLKLKARLNARNADRLEKLRAAKQVLNDRDTKGGGPADSGDSGRMI